MNQYAGSEQVQALAGVLKAQPFVPPPGGRDAEIVKPGLEGVASSRLCAALALQRKGRN